MATVSSSRSSIDTLTKSVCNCRMTTSLARACPISDQRFKSRSLSLSSTAHTDRSAPKMATQKNVSLIATILRPGRGA